MGERGRVAVFTLGGTIAMRNAGGGAVPALDGPGLLASIPGLSDAGLEIETHNVAQVPGAAVGFDDVFRLVPAIEERLAAGVNGVVVTQGTDTIEETVYLLDLLHHGDAPVVVTGAMRNPSLAGADGPANLLAAVAVAASPRARGMGALVAFGDQIHAARQVRKAHATSPAAFVSPNSGPLGHVVEGEARFLSRPVEASVTKEMTVPRPSRMGPYPEASIWPRRGPMLAPKTPVSTTTSS